MATEITLELGLRVIIFHVTNEANLHFKITVHICTMCMNMTLVFFLDC